MMPRVTHAQNGKNVTEAFTLDMGENTCTFQKDESYETPRFFAFTATERGLLKIEGNNTAASYTAVDADSTEVSRIMTMNSCIIPMLAGSTVYVQVSPNMYLENETIVNFYASFEANDNACRGTSINDPITIEDGKVNVTIDNVAGFSEFNSYFVYKAEDTGALNLVCSGYVLSGRYGNSFDNMNGSFSTNYENGSYIGSVPVNKGETIYISISAYTAMTVSSMMTYPEKGSSPNYPIELVEGSNDVSAEFGEFWYQYNGAPTDGYITISSEFILPRGHVSVYGLSDLYSALAQSVSGSYDLRFKVKANTPYLIYILKTEESDNWPEPDKINVSFSEFEQGETANNPINLTANVTKPLNTSTGTFYYAITVAESGKMIEMNVEGENANSYFLTLYDMSEGQYFSVTGMGSVKKEANAGHSYMLILEKNMMGDAVLNPVVRDVNEGETLSKPKVAVLGANNLAKTQEIYYTYTATLNGRIEVGFDIPGVFVEFPVSVNSDLGTYSTITEGGKTKIDVIEGKKYYMHFINVTDDCTFTLAEKNYQPGETREMAITVTGTKAIIENGMMNVWFTYKANKTGKMTLSSNIVGDPNTSIYYFVNDDVYPIAINGSNEDGDIIYNSVFGVKKDDVIYVHLVAPVEHVDNYISFDLEDFGLGESLATAYELIPNGSSLTIPVATRTQNQWVRIPIKEAGRITITTDRFIAGGVYTDSNVNRDYDIFFTADENNEVHTAVYESAEPVEALYVRVESSFGKIVITAETEAVVSIEDAPSADAEADVFTLSGIRTKSVLRGINIIRKADGSVKKIIR